MSRLSRISLALLAGVLLIWLVQLAAAAIAAVPGLGSSLRWLRDSNLPMEIITLGALIWLPVFVASFLVGLIGFRIQERRGLLLLCIAAPFVLFSLWMNIGMLVAAGNMLAFAVTDLNAWSVVAATFLGLGCAHLSTPRHSAA